VQGAGAHIAKIGSFLAERAPQLESLALHGLQMPEAPLVELARGCPRLQRVHFWGCFIVCEALAHFLLEAHSLVHADLSAGPLLKSAPNQRRAGVPTSMKGEDQTRADVLIDWIEQRRATGGNPVRSLVLHGCPFAEAVAWRAPEIVTHTGERTRLFDFVQE